MPLTQLNGGKSELINHGGKSELKKSKRTAFVFINYLFKSFRIVYLPLTGINGKRCKKGLFLNYKTIII